MTDSIVSGPGPLSNGSETPSPSQWLRIHEAASLFNLSESYLRKGTERKKNPIPHIRLGEGGERRFQYRELCRFLGIRNGNGDSSDGRTPVGLVARVSGRQQSKGITKGSEDNDLARQIKRLETFAAEKWGESATISKYYGTGSGLNYERPEFIRLIGDVLQGRFSGGFIVAQTFDRCCRFGIQLVELCCKHGNCELIFTEENPDKELYENISDEIIAIVGYFHAKTMGLRASKTTSVVMSDETIKETIRLFDQGIPLHQIQRVLEKDGHRAVNPPDKVISYYVIRKLLLQHGKVLTAALPKKSSLNSWDLFRKECLIYEGPESKLRLPKAELYRAYSSYCTKNNLVCLTAMKVGKLTKDIPRRYTHTGRVALVGLKIRGLECSG